jgi:hypothetical protein
MGFKKFLDKVNGFIASKIELYSVTYEITPKTEGIYQSMMDFTEEMNLQIAENNIDIKNRATKYITNKSIKQLKKQNVYIFGNVVKKKNYIEFTFNSTVPFLKLPNYVKNLFSVGTDRILRKYLKQNGHKEVSVKRNKMKPIKTIGETN